MCFTFEDTFASFPSIPFHSTPKQSRRNHSFSYVFAGKASQAEIRSLEELFSFK
jgi:hypothetical protein